MAMGMLLYLFVLQLKLMSV